MGKRIIPRARGKGGPRYRTPSHRFLGRVQYFPIGSFTAKVVDIMHDPGRSSPVMLIKSEEGKEVLHIAPEGIQAGDLIRYGDEVKTGNVLELEKVPIGTKVSCLETYPGSGPKLCRSSGSYAQVSGTAGDKIIIHLSSGKEKMFNGKCRAMIGIPAGSGRIEKPWVKVGKRWYAMHARGKIFPRSAGVSMSPVEHPYGGKKKAVKFKTVSRSTPPGRKIGSIAARRTGKRKR
jgi:large subunit ribosomal protein L2